MVAKVLCLAFALLCAASAAPEGRLVGGDHTTIENFPYIAAFVYYYPGPSITIQRCVGSLVSSWHVLTTAFCFTGANLNNMDIRVGSTNSLNGGVMARIGDVIKHPDYVEAPRSADIAVVVLANPLNLGSTINILFIPPQGTYLPDGLETKVVSWGFESEQGPQLETLKTVLLNKLPLAECQNQFAGVEDIDINAGVICASAPGRGICLGDSGAPMVVNNVLVGLSSFFKDCGTDEYPDVFTRIDSYTDWIMSVATPPTRSGTGIPVTIANVF